MTVDENSKGTQAKVTETLSYRDAGVDIDAGNSLVEKIKVVSRRTNRPEVLSELGGFGAMCEIPQGYKQPVLVSATDGVGTKLKLAMTMNRHDTIGIDLVAMCVNDLIVCGAEPLFFLDYYATGDLNVETAAKVVSGIGRGCEIAGCALIGGETAEMPGMYSGGDYDLAGFSVGIVEKSEIIDQKKVAIGDHLIGLASSGPHSNGFSLIRKIIDSCGADLNEVFGDNTLGETLLAPTTIYVKTVAALAAKVNINAIAHITGGGLTENIPRVLPNNAQAVINTNSWARPAIFNWLQDRGNVVDEEMYRTFNCGIGLVLCIPASQSKEALNLLKEMDVDATRLGSIAAKADSEKAIILK